MIFFFTNFLFAAAAVAGPVNYGLRLPAEEEKRSENVNSHVLLLSSSSSILLSMFVTNARSVIVDRVRTRLKCFRDSIDALC